MQEGLQPLPKLKVLFAPFLPYTSRCKSDVVFKECAQLVGVVFFVRWSRPYVGIQKLNSREIRRLKSEGTTPAVQFEEPGEDAKLDEECEADDEASLPKAAGGAQDGDHEELGRINQEAGWRGSWQKELAKIEQRRNDLLPEHEKTQMMSQPVQSLEDKVGATQENRASFGKAAR